MPNEEKIEIRDLRDGDWYWVHKAVIQEYASKIGAIAIVIYDFLASLADSNQKCFPSQKYISETLGYSRATINKKIKLLERNRLIRIEKRNRYHCVYQLLKVRCKARETQMSTKRNSDVNSENTNNNKLTKIINNIVNDNKYFLKLKDSFKGFKPETKEELLAMDLAEGLRDRKSFSFYKKLSKSYPENLLRKVLGEVKEIPDCKIKKSRASLFTHLIQKYAKEASKNNWS